MSRPKQGSESATRLRRAPRLALTRQEAAAALGMSINSFERHVQPELRLVRRGKLRLIPVREIERWLEENSDFVLEQLGRR
jgi:hypothetical protein